MEQIKSIIKNKNLGENVYNYCVHIYNNLIKLVDNRLPNPNIECDNCVVCFSWYNQKSQKTFTLIIHDDNDGFVFGTISILYTYHNQSINIIHPLDSNILCCLDFFLD